MKGWARIEFGDGDTRIMGIRASRQERFLDGKTGKSNIQKRFKMFTMTYLMGSSPGFPRGLYQTGNHTVLERVLSGEWENF